MATISRGYETKVDLKNAQRTLCLRSAGTARWAYNDGLARKQEALAQRKAAVVPTSVNLPIASDAHNERIALMQSTRPWLKAVSEWSPQQAVHNLDTTFDRFFKRQATYPQLKKRSKGIVSFSVETPIHVRVDWLQLPLIGKVRLFEHGHVPQDSELDTHEYKAEKGHKWKHRDGTPRVQYKSAVISEQAGHRIVSVRVEETVPDPIPATGELIGVDVSIKTFATCSDGTEIANPKALKTNLATLQPAQRRYGKRKTGSKNKQKSNLQLAKVDCRIAHLRQDALQQATARITAEAKPVSERPQAIILENLNISGLLTNHGLAQARAAMGREEFRRQLLYKSNWYGTRPCLAHAFHPSTQVCPACHRLPSAQIDLGVRTDRWEHCGPVLDRDLNAACTLLWLYTASSAEIDAGGETVRPMVRALAAGTLKQGPNAS